MIEAGSSASAFVNFAPHTEDAANTARTHSAPSGKNPDIGDLPPLPNGNAARSQSAALISNINGDPSIDGVMLNFSIEDMSAALLTLQGKTQDSQLRTAQNGLQVSQQKIANNNKLSMEKLQTWIDKSKSAESKSKFGKILGWIGKIAAVVGTAISTIALLVATPFSAGATVPLLALSIIGLVGASMSLASAISKEAGGPPLELSNLLTKVSSIVLKFVGVPEDKLESASRIMAGAFAVATGAFLIDTQLAGNFAAGVVQLSTNSQTAALYTGMAMTMLTGLAVTALTTFATGGTGAAAAVTDTTKIIKEISDAAKTFGQVATATKYVNGAVSAANTIVSASVNISVAIDEHAGAMAQVDRQKFAALIIKLQTQMEEDKEQITRVVQEMQDGYSTVSKICAAAGESRMQISANIGRTMA